MDFQLNETQKLIQETARRIAKEKIAPRAAEIDETQEYPHDIFAAFRETGLTGPDHPAAVRRQRRRHAPARASRSRRRRSTAAPPA